MTTQPDALNWLNAQLGQHLDYDNSWREQCVDFFNYYYRQTAGRDPYADGLHAPAVNGAKDLWNFRLADFTYLADSATLKPEPGDIAIYGGGWGLGSGHVEVVSSTDANGCYFIGENEHGNTSEGVVRVYRTWLQMRGLLGVMRPNWYVPPTAPAYTITAMEPKQLHVVANHYKWNLAQPNFDAIVGNPITTSGTSGTEFTAVAVLTRPDLPNYKWYLEDANTPHGWNALDCEDIVVPPPLPTPPAPYVPPAAPVKGTLAKKYTVLTTIMHFDKAQDAIFHKDAKGTVQPGVYFQFETQDTAVQLGTDNMNALYWINTKDNAAPVAPQKPAADDWKQGFTPFPDGKSRRYIAQRDMFLYDLAAPGADGINIKHGDSVPIYGSVQKGELTYLIPRLNADTVEGQVAPKEHWYGVPTTSVYTGLPNMKSQQYIDALAQAEVENRVYRKSVHHETTEDKVYYAEQIMARAVKDGICFIDGIIGPKGFAKIKAAIGRRDNKK